MKAAWYWKASWLKKSQEGALTRKKKWRSSRWGPFERLAKETAYQEVKGKWETKPLVFLAMCFAFSTPSSHTVFKNHLIFRARRNFRYHQSLWFSNLFEPKGEFFKSYQKPIWKTDKRRWSGSRCAMSQKAKHTHTHTHDFPTVVPKPPPQNS